MEMHACSPHKQKVGYYTNKLLFDGLQNTTWTDIGMGVAPPD